MKKKFFNKLFTALIFLISVVSFSQNTQDNSSLTVKKDTLPLKYNFQFNQKGSLFLNNPSEFKVSYDKELNKFVIVEKIGDYYVGTPVFMTPEEYSEYKLKNDISSYFKEKVDAENTKKKGTKNSRKNLLPKYYVNSKFFESIFGGNTVEVTPTGQINIKLGVIYQNNENPQISIQNQSSFTFDFDQQISAGLQAKVGKRLRVTANYDTQSTFDFQNIIKLEYTPTEDDIIRNIEAGNISMPIKNSLINGAQALFGVKTELQFGKTFVTAAFSQQNSQSKTVVAQGGATIEPFELRATDYDNDRHFFLSQYFRERYEKALANYPLINSPVNITRVEVWVTNQTQDVNDYRSIVALADLGESNSIATSNNLVNNEVEDLVTTPVKAGGLNLPYNNVNKLRSLLTDTQIRDVATVDDAINGLGLGFTAQQGYNYSYLQNARKLQPNEYRLHPQLGYVSLNRRLNDGEVLAVAFEYTVVGATEGGATSTETVFKVGEFSNDGVVAPENIVVKLLRSEILNTVRPNITPKEAFPTWKLMMKNVYAIGAFPLQREGFRFELMYRDDGTGTLQNTLQNATTPDVNNTTLLRLANLDKLDQSQYAIPNGDGFFDFVPGVTVNTERGYIIFPETEPFGKNLDEKLDAADDKYVFNELYLTTKIQAKNEYQDKDKFFLKGYFKSETSRGISLGAFNIPRGSVRVTAGGRQLVEGVDYVVDYQLGRVQILDPGLEASGIPINASVENNTFFNQQRKTFIGVDVEHRFSENFTLGGTFLNVTERPITPKVNFGGEPIDNIMFGLNLDYSSEVPYLTKLANKLPFVDTEAPSNVSVRADMAYLLPGSPRGINVDGTAISYLDDFEASQIPINLSSPQQWFLASTPIEPTTYNGDKTGDVTYNYKRAKLAWYNVDQLFYGGSNRPSNIDENELSRNEVRQIRYEELYPETDLDITQQNLVRTLDLAYYPSERGPYNFNTGTDVGANGKFINPEENWAGIMRALTTNNFEQSNVEYIQFWLLDPYDNYTISEAEGLPTGVNPDLLSNQEGKLFFNLGNISEDVLRDGFKQYENGLPEDGSNTNTRTSIWGKVPSNPSILYAFGSTGESRTNQDVGLDGVKNDAELQFIRDQINPSLGIPVDESKLNLDDPAGDNFQFFRGGAIETLDPTILQRYKNYNGTEGNSPTPEQSSESYPTSSNTYPDVEDINKDQTMNPVNSYYEYEISLNKADLDLANNRFIVDIKKDREFTLSNGQTITPRWYQFRIPVRSGTAVGGISDFNSIRFMRMYVNGFKIPVVLRFAELELVRGDWRRYTKTLPDNINTPQQNLTSDELNNFEVGVVSIEQNQEIYQLPPGIQREQLQGTNRIQRQNEQSVTLKVTDLPVNDVRTIYKNISIDMRRYKNLRMFLHAEEVPGVTTDKIPDDNEMVAIIRLGTDLNDNYYEIEKPLVLSTSSTSSLDVWPKENNLDISLKELSSLKIERPDGNFSTPYSSISSNGLKITVRGNPTLAQIRTVMLGVKNTAATEKTVEVWFNELRAAGFDNKGGWAAVINADANMADVLDVSLAGRMSTIGFGNVEDRVQQRSIEEIKQYSVATNIQLGKMMPKKWNMQVPMTYTYGEEFRDPQYDPQFQDVTIDQAKNSNSEQAKRNLKNAQDYTRRESISFINVKKNRNPESKKKPKFYDVENLSVSYSHNEEFHKDYNIQKFVNQNVMAGASYNFNFQPWNFEPFKKSKLFKSKYLQFLKDLNFNPVPKTIALNSRINRSYTAEQSRNLIEGLTAQPELVQRRFMFNWDYTVGFDLTKSLQLNFNATNNYIYDSFGQDEELDVYDKFLNIGRPDKYHQKLNATYKIPINKLPYLSFISADYAYTADFDWEASSRGPIFDDTGLQIGTIYEKVGNMIQNANTHNLNANIDFGRFYKTLKLDKLLLKGTKQNKAQKGKSVPANNSKQLPQKAKLKRNATFTHKVMKGFYDVLTSVKRAKISYTENNGTLLQGYRPSIGFLGRDNFSGGLAPTLGFVFGSQTDILRTAIENDWLVTRNAGEEYYNKNYGNTSVKKLDYNISVKPFKSLTIDLRADRVKTSNITQQLDVVNDGNGNFAQDENLKPYETGNFSSSYFMLGTMFTDNETLFQNFLDYRTTIANRLTNETGYDSSGFTLKGQQVMLPAFMAAYSGKNPNDVNTGIFRNIPIPNWTLRFNGFMKYKWFKKNFSSFTLSHGYKSSYTLGNYTNNLQYEIDGVTNAPVTNTSGNYQPQLLIATATLIDEFSPLVKVDFKMKNSISFKGEIRRDRSLTLNFNNNTLTDIKGTEYVVGLGYKIRDVKFVTRFTGKKETLKGDINLRADVSLRDNLTLIRSIDENNNQITGGEKLFGLKFIADYNLSSNLTASLYYNHQTFNYAISTTFPRQSINAGINLIYNLGK